jgi:3alpha(or 20beta)-hydroxysteroid dehydrogenase
MTGRLEGRTAVITGGAQGQGEAEVRRFVAERAQVLVADVGAESGSALAGELGDNVRFARLDVASADDWRAGLAQISDWPPVSILINNAAVHWLRPIVDETAEGLVDMFNVNVVGALLGMQAVFEPMQRAGGGSIINVCSVLGLLGGRNNAAYTTTKWALRGLTKTAAIELGSLGIRVNAVHPGYISTPMLAETAPDRPDAYYEYLPLGRAGVGSEIADLMVFLASEESRYITGADFAIDGGMTTGTGPRTNFPTLG